MMIRPQKRPGRSSTADVVVSSLGCYVEDKSCSRWRIVVGRDDQSEEVVEVWLPMQLMHMITSYGSCRPS